MASSTLKRKIIQTDALPNTKLFNAGCRKSTDSFRLRHFIENITQALLHALNLKDAWILIGGDGRTYSKEIFNRIIHVLAGNGVQRVFVPLDGYLPTPAAAYLLRESYCHLGFVITGGHQPPGDNGFTGIKMVSPPGIPIRKEIIDKTNRILKSLQSYSACEKLMPDFNDVGETVYNISGRNFSIEVFDIVSPYVQAVKEKFDLPCIKEYICQNLNLLIDCSNGAQLLVEMITTWEIVQCVECWIETKCRRGRQIKSLSTIQNTVPYPGVCLFSPGPHLQRQKQKLTSSIVKRIFVDELGVQEKRILNSNTLADYGNFPPNPNLRNYKDFIKHMQEGECNFGAVVSPDGCRCMIVGEDGFVIPPSDSLAIIAVHHLSILLFQEKKLEAVVRTICMSKAVDRVAESLSLLRFEVPIGWHNFDSAMIPGKGKAIIFGEESYGLGISSDTFCAERDGILAVLSWLSILASLKKSIREVTEEHWKVFGRSFFGRLDFYDISNQQMDAFLYQFREKNSLRFEKIKSESYAGLVYLDPFGIDPKLQTEEAKRQKDEIVFDIENYVYPYGFMKKSLLSDDQYQAYQIRLMGDARLVIRRSESISNSSTLRFYIEYYVEPGHETIFEDREVILKPFMEAAMKITKIQDFISADTYPIFI